ncbi:MAG: maleylpyruvate isomerase family protein [Chloroflexi bacterium]|nr:MAG: maleylpyruvate isomerase family protein [Chloroflexota bacterium]
MEAQPSRLRQAGDWYLDNVEAVPADGWGHSTLCAGWTARHVVAHVASGDQLFLAMLMDALGKDRTGLDLPTDFADRRQRFEAMSNWEPARLKESAKTASVDMVAAVGDAAREAPQTIVNVPFGQVPIPVVRGLRLNEYIIHGHDLTPAIGRSLPIPDWFIDRALGDSINMMSRLHQRSPHKGKAASFHIHRTDGEGEWILRAADGQAVAESTHGKADVALRGPGEGLYWVLMGRGSPGDHGIEIHGDPALGAGFKEWFPGP